MIVKKYPQSNLVISKGDQKIVIDIGNYSHQHGYNASEFKDCQAILFTHQHQDHLDSDHIKEIVEGKEIFGNADVVAKLKELGVKAAEIKDREEFSAGGFKIMAVNLPHCKMVDGTDGPPNMGYLIEGILFHPGDGDIAPEGIKSANVALPIAGPSINYQGAIKFAKDLEAKVVIPIHFDGKFPGSGEEFKKLAEGSGIEVRPLKHGEETEL